VVVVERAKGAILTVAERRSPRLAHTGEHDDCRTSEPSPTQLSERGLFEDAEQPELLAARTGRAHLVVPGHASTPRVRGRLCCENAWRHTFSSVRELPCCSSERRRDIGCMCLGDPVHVGAPAHRLGPGRGDGDHRAPRPGRARFGGTRSSLERGPHPSRQRDDQPRAGTRRDRRGARLPAASLPRPSRRLRRAGRSCGTRWNVGAPPSARRSTGVSNPTD